MMYEEFNFKTEAEWLAKRKEGIGSSEAAAVLGWSRFSSPWAVWARKTGKVDELGGGPNELTEWGHRHEPAIAKKFSEVTGRKVEDPGEYYLIQSGVLMATIDRWQRHEGRTGVLELKCAWYDAWDEWEERVPVAYQIQIQHQLCVSGSDFGSVAVLGNGYQFKFFHVTRSEKFILKMSQQLHVWWQRHVVGGEPPPADANPATAEAIAKVYPEVKTERIDLPGEVFWEIHEQRERAAAEISRLEKVKDEATNKIKAAIGEAEYGVLSDGSGYSFKKTAKVRQLRRIEKCPQR